MESIGKNVSKLNWQVIHENAIKRSRIPIVYIEKNGRVSLANMPKVYTVVYGDDLIFMGYDAVIIETGNLSISYQEGTTSPLGWWKHLIPMGQNTMIIDCISTGPRHIL